MVLTSALLFLALTATSVSAQLAPATLPSYTPTENWMDAAQVCFGNSGSSTWMLDLSSDADEMWLDETHRSMVILRNEDHNGFAESAAEAADGSFSGTGAAWTVKGESRVAGTELRQISYTVTIGGKVYPASCLLVPSVQGGTVVMTFAADAPTLSAQTDALATAFSRDGNGQSLLALHQN